MRGFVLLVCATLLSVAVGVAILGTAGGDALGRPVAKAVTLPTSWAAIGNRTLSSADGEPALFGIVPYPGSPDGDCYRADLVPGSEVVRSLVVGNCDDPRLSPYGGKVTYVAAQIAPSYRVEVRISHLTKSGRVVLGPVVMTFYHYSDTWIVPTYGDGELWLYDVSTLNGAVLLGISANTGRTLQSVRMPKLWRPDVAVNDDAIFFGNTEGSADIYEVAFRAAARPKLVYSGAGRVSSLSASGHHLVARFFGPKGTVSEKTFVTQGR